MVHKTGLFSVEAETDDVAPDGDAFDTGIASVPQDGGERRASFIMPYNGYVYRFGVTWPAGANSAVGVNLGLTEPEESPGDSIPSLDGWVLTQEQYDIIEQVVDEVGTFFPKNYPNPRFIADDDRWIPFYLVKKVPKGTKVEVTVRNESTTNDHELQSRVQTFNFDPRQLQSLPGGM